MRNEQGGHIFVHIGLIAGKFEVRHRLGNGQAPFKGGLGQEG
jgi:hypothetical protein